MTVPLPAEYAVIDPLPDRERNIFDIGDVTGKKLDYFRFQNRVVYVKFWSEMFIHVFHRLSQENPSKLMSVSEENEGLKIERDEKLIKEAPKSIGSDLFISTNLSNKEKVRYLQNALSSFNMGDSLWVKLK